MKQYDAVIMPAALSDFIPAQTKGKLDSSEPITIRMKKAPKIISSIRRKHKGLLYAFKLGSRITDSKLIEKAKALLKNSDCVIANYSDAMGSKDSKVAIIDKENTDWVTGSKMEISRKILEKIALEL
jgi:phosphopantothenoylcysteine synthetase/decarboxylase